MRGFSGIMSHQLSKLGEQAGLDSIFEFHRLFFLLSRQEVLSRAFVTVFWFNYFVSGPPLKLVKAIVTYLKCLSDVID